MFPIKQVSGHIIKDSRNEDTIEASIQLESGAIGVASAPAGKSKGIHEAATVEAKEAVEIISDEIANNFAGKSFETQKDFDDALIKLDGTGNKSRIGGNTTTALSLAFARAAAVEKHIPLYKYISDSLGNAPRGQLRLFANMIEGGLHAKNNLRFQEHLAIPEAVSLANQADTVKKFYAEIGAELKKRFPESKITLSDEGSYSMDFQTEDMPFVIMDELRGRRGLSGSLDFGMDAAASDVKGSPEELAEIYKDWRSRFGLIAIEDPFAEEDFGNFKKLKSEMNGVAIIGDDLTTTNVELMEKAKKADSINGVIIKPNQIGTITEAFSAIRAAREYGWIVVVSHRSGETLDDWIADFAYGIGADGFKLGSPSRPERIAKYERLLQIEKEIGNMG